MGSGRAGRPRRLISLTLAVLGAVLALLGGVLLYARAELFDANAFADDAEAALTDQQVRLAIAQPIVDAVLDSGPSKLVNARPLIESAVVGVLGTAPVKAAFREAVKTAHEKLFERNPESLLLDLADVAVVATSAVESISPKLAEKLPAKIAAADVNVIESDVAIDTLAGAERIRFFGVLGPLLALLALIGSVAVATDRRAGLIRAAVAVAIAAGLGVALLVVGRSLVLSQFDNDLVYDAAAATWDAFLGGLLTWMLVAGAAVVILAAAATFGEEPVDLLAPGRRIAAALRWTPRAALPRLGRAVGLGALSVAVLLRPDLALSVVAILAGAWGLYVAVTEVMLVLAPPQALGQERSGWRRVRPGRAATLLAGIAVAVVAVIAITGGGEESAGRPPGPVAACNGFAELCDRPLNEVTLPATHNSMSAASEPGWYTPNQRYGITRQLDDGIRALLIDTHYGVRRGNGRGFGEVITDLSKEKTTRSEIVAQLGEDAVGRAESLIGKLAFGGVEGTPQPFLCHVLCELGATDLVDALAGIRDWMSSHPDEFLVIFIEDVVSPAETAKAFEDSGLLRYAYVHEPGAPLPTLRELIESDKRLLVMAEKNAGHGRYPWYLEGFDLVQETPFTFHTEQELSARSSCDPNRGGPDNPLFQINNWIETIPRDPDLAGRVNSFDALDGRSRLCERIRGLQPNILAVDYYNEGDVFAVAKDLNGIGAHVEPTYRTVP